MSVVFFFFSLAAVKKISAFMTHFQKVDPSLADKTLNETVTSWKSALAHTQTKHPE